MAYFETLILNILKVGARQWLKLQVPNFLTFTPVPYLQEHPMYKDQASKFTAILDSTFTWC